MEEVATGSGCTVLLLARGSWHMQTDGEEAVELTLRVQQRLAWLDLQRAENAWSCLHRRISARCRS